MATSHASIDIRHRAGDGRPGLTQQMHGRVDAASLALFRMAFGGILLWEVFRYFGKGRIGRYYIDPEFHFKYYGFEWVQPWPGDGMYLHFACLGCFAACVALGLFYRVASVLLFLSFTYVFLLDQTHYLNHFYLICLVCFLMIWVPAHRTWSLDAMLWPSVRSDTVPAWSVWLLRAQMGLVYFYAGVAKLNADWLAGEPLRHWLGARDDLPAIGRFVTEEWFVYLFSYGGLVFDLAIAPALLWRRTRAAAFIAALGFHLTNSYVFNIGVFPWLAIAATTMFFSPDWPRRFLFGRGTHHRRQGTEGTDSVGGRSGITMMVAVYLGIQVLVPLRHLLYPGHVAWTEQGHRFSWRMKLRSKNGTVRIRVTDAAGITRWRVDPRAFLTTKQIREMSGRPDMILQAAHYVARRARQEFDDTEELQVRIESDISLNYRPGQALIDPEVDLAAVERSLAPARWITRLTTPLHR